MTGADLEETVLLLRGDSFKPEAISWVWPGYLAEGKMVLIGGRPGSGKTTIACAVAATLTRGGKWPDGSISDQGDVVMWSGEDDVSDTLAPRMLATGADMTRVHFVGPVTVPKKPKGAHMYGTRPFDPATDTEQLALAMNRIPNVRLLIVDPIVSAVAGDSHRNAETRRGLQPLVDLARSYKCALLGVTHFSKGTAGRDPLDRITGSLAFVAMARIVLVAAQEQAEDGQEGRRVLMRAKSNIGPDDGGFAYELRKAELQGHPGVIASSVAWTGAVEGSARDVLAETEQQDEQRAATNDAADFLRAVLADGPRPCKEVLKEGDSAGFSRDQLKRALHKIGGKAKKQGMAGGWYWSLPEAREGSRAGNGAPFQVGGNPPHQNGAPFAPFTSFTSFEEREESEGCEESMNLSAGKLLSSAPSSVDHDEIDRQFYPATAGGSL